MRHALVAAVIDRYGRSMVTDVVRKVLAEARDEIAGGGVSIDDENLVDRVARAVEAQAKPTLRRVFNLTGTILHTNLGRAPLPAEAIEESFRKLTRPEGSELIGRNRAMHRLLVDGVTVEYRDAEGVIRGGQARVIDFDDCGLGWFLYDAATAVTLFEHHPEVPALLDSWLEGYRRVRPLPKQEETELWTLIMMRRLILFAWFG